MRYFCKYCGTEYIPSITKKYYCSKECVMKSMEEKLVSSFGTKLDNVLENINLLNEKTLAICNICGKEFRIILDKQQSCSKECYQYYLIEKWKANGIELVLKNEELNISTEKYQKICKWCKTQFQSVNNNRIYCSEKCGKLHSEYNKDMRFLLSKHKEVISDIDKKTEKMRLNFGNRTINTWLISGFSSKLKESILERDGFKCYICEKETNLHVHHIIPRKEGGPHIPENLITLCGGCHRSIESGDLENAILKCVGRAVKNINEQ